MGEDNFGSFNRNKESVIKKLASFLENHPENLESLKRYIKIEINNLENHPENLESLKEAVGGDTNKVLGDTRTSSENIETSEISEYTFNGKKVEVLDRRYSWGEAMKISEEKGLIVLNLEGLKALCEDYTEKFPDWKEDKCKKTIRNPIGLNISTYWSSTEYSSITARVLFMNNRGAANNYLKENNHYVVCVPI